ncbi:MAG: putative sugar transferase EpsL [Firmicutes bacterium ADurb.Bin300]|nr:MAG: putative sugar transferase EpsL [Firmicutes bacterium ADurb.Bin300]
MYPVIKRIFDLIISLFGLMILSPLFLTLMLIIRLTSEGPVFFKQERIGIHKNHFMVYKFRTMRIDTPANIPTHLLEEPEKYITGVGRFLRATSLDELPQLLNIIKGEMSIIGPRPALWNQDDLVEAREKYGANDILPGLSGLAQISGRDELPIEEKANLDGEYVEKFGFLIDVQCLFGTIFAVLKRKGVVEGKTDDSQAQSQFEVELAKAAATTDGSQQQQSGFESSQQPLTR